MSDKLTFLSSKDFKKVASKSDSTNLLGVRKQYVPESIKQKGDENSRIFEFVISTGAVDRDKDTINSKGWDLKNYKKNPIVLFSHDSSRPPIGRGLSIKVKDDKLKANVEFMDNDIDTTGFSDTIFRMIRGGFLRATSVGFIPKEFEFVDDDDKDRDGGSWFAGIDFIKQELLEFSIVPVPSNPEALIEARSKGIDTTPLFHFFEEALDDWAEYKGMLLVPRKEIENLYKTIKNNNSKSNTIFNLSKGQQAELVSRNLDLMRKQREEEKSEKVEDKQIVITESTEGHTHEIDDTKSGVSGPASNGNDHDHSYEFGDEETALGGDDMHKHGLPKFKDSDLEEEEEVESSGDDKPNSYPSGTDDGDQPNEHPMMMYGKLVNQDGELLVGTENGKFETYTLEFLQENSEELPDQVTKDDIKWLIRINESEETETIEETNQEIYNKAMLILAEKFGKTIDELKELSLDELSDLVVGFKATPGERVEINKEDKLDDSPIKLKIITDGTSAGTKVLDSVSGRLLDIESATFKIDVDSKKAMLQLVLTEALIELQQFSSEEEEIIVTEPEVSKSKETDIKEYSADEVADALNPEEDIEEKSTSKEIEFSDDEILDVIKDVVPDMLRDIIRTEIGRMKGQLSQ